MRISISGALAAATLTLAGCDNPTPGSKIDVTLPEDFYTTREADVSAVLDTFYTAAKGADFDTWIAQFTSDSWFYGTDATEAWPYAEFSVDIRQGFASGTGWDFELRDRKVTISPDGMTAWYAELAYFRNTNYLLRPTGVLVKQADGQWRISQLVMGVPFPNDIYEPFLNGLQGTEAGAEVEENAVDAVLTEMHLSAHNGRLTEYLSLYTEDAIFIGTDETENWSKKELQAYAEPAFADGHGWSYDLIERNIVLSPMKNIAWFDELLENKAYGTTRGTGTLIRGFDGWKIAQYHLSLPIPNEIAQETVERIKAEKTKQSAN